MLKRLIGQYNPRRDPDVLALNTSITPTPDRILQFQGFDIYTGCGASSVQAKNGKACLFTGWTQEVPLYYSIYRDTLYYHEQYLALPPGATLVERGQAVIWHPETGITKFNDIETIPRPSICVNSLDTAIAQYPDIILNAVQQRIEHCGATRVALSQSGGLDSCLIAWALHKLGVEFVPLVACTTLEAWDYQMAMLVLSQLKVEPVPILIKEQDLGELFEEATFCYESSQFDNLQMAVSNIAIARHCQKLGLDVIFNGHAHDDLMGTDGLVQGTYKKLQGTESERWRDARRDSISGFGMEKMFAATFRRYGMSVQMPFLDTDLAYWVYSQPVNVIPVKAKKPFARLTTREVLPIGEWSREVYNRHGYIAGSGFYESDIREAIEVGIEASKVRLAFLKTLPWRQIAQMHTKN